MDKPHNRCERRLVAYPSTWTCPRVQPGNEEVSAVKTGRYVAQQAKLQAHGQPHSLRSTYYKEMPTGISSTALWHLAIVGQFSSRQTLAHRIARIPASNQSVEELYSLSNANVYLNFRVRIRR